MGKFALMKHINVCEAFAEDEDEATRYRKIPLYYIGSDEEDIFPGFGVIGEIYATYTKLYFKSKLYLLIKYK